MTLEEQIRGLFAATVQEIDEMPPLELRDRGISPRRPWLMPALVASAVAVMVVVVSAVVQLGSGRSQPSGPIDKGAPRFVVVSAPPWTPDSEIPPRDGRTHTWLPRVQDARTGHTIASIPLPKGTWATERNVVGAADNRTFVLSVYLDPKPSYQIGFFVVHLDEHGHPGTPRLLGVRPDSDNGFNTLALSPDGRRIAFTETNSPDNSVATVVVSDTQTGTTRQWTAAADQVSDVSWMPNGKQLAILSGSRNQVDLLDIQAQPGPLAKVVRHRDVPALAGLASMSGVVVAPDGKTLLVAASPASDSEGNTKLFWIPFDGPARQIPVQVPSEEYFLYLDRTGRYLLTNASDGRGYATYDLKTGRIHTFTIPIGADGGKGSAAFIAW